MPSPVSMHIYCKVLVHPIHKPIYTVLYNALVAALTIGDGHLEVVQYWQSLVHSILSFSISPVSLEILSTYRRLVYVLDNTCGLRWTVFVPDVAIMRWPLVAFLYNKMFTLFL